MCTKSNQAGLTKGQTELGHGSNVRGIELQAKWDPKTKEFILHSPSLTASKWWNGTLGRTANHAIVVAQLLLPTKSSTATTEKGYTSYGPHPFIVQVRDLKTHQPLPGIAVGDIGPKYGYASMDNAYMLFDNFHIPHAAFLSRYASVDPLSGAYSKPPNPAVVYGSLTYVRANIVMHARLVLARAVTIAIRYLSIRHQFPSRDAPRGPEVTTLDYPTVQTRILPLLATTFALHYSGTAMARQYARTRAGISGGDFGALADLHGTSSGLKSLCTTLAGDGVETCRRALGGHGYGGGSGLVQLNADYLSKPTVEGDNWMITQQTAAWLIKKVERARAAGGEREGPAADATEGHIRGFLRASRFGDRGNKFDVLHSDKAVVEAFRFRAAWMAVRAHEERVVKGRSWNSLLIQLHALSNAHSQSVLVENFYAALHDPPLGAAKSAAGEDERPVPEGARPVLKKLFRLFALSTLLSSPGAALEFQSSGCISLSQLSALPSAIQSLMAEIRPHAVALVDAWSLPEYLLDSALGRYDGRVYEDLFERASNIERNPLNAETFNPRYWEGEIVLGSGRGWDGRLLEEEGMVSKGRGLRGKL